MATTYPSKIKTFIIAEALRQEAGSKVTIMGALAAGQILFAPGTIFPVMIPFAIYAVFDDGEGTFNTRLKILDPNGNPITGELPIGNSVKEAKSPLQLVLNFNIFQLPTTGIYTIEILMDDHVYSEHLSVRISDKPIT